MKPYRFPIQTISHILKQKINSVPITVYGYIKTVRSQKQMTFIEINDGSSSTGLQSIIDSTKLPTIKLSTGCTVRLQGTMVSSPNRKQSVELVVDKLELLGDAIDYPLHKGRIPIETLRDHQHLRSRSNLFGAIWRIRNTLVSSIHAFFQSQEFTHVHPPILTTSDCEGGGESFEVVGGNTFFGKNVYMSVSSQLHLEVLTHALSRVYALNPAFRAEPSDSTRHLAEFWMVEAEMAYLTNLDSLLDFIEAQIRFSIQSILNTSLQDLEFCDGFVQPGLLDMLQGLVENPFGRMTYTKAIELLSLKKEWHYPVQWGLPLQTEHEKYLAEEIQHGPLFITDYPTVVKPFYMKQNHNKTTVACTDLIFPKWGEVVGGSVREDRLDILKENIHYHKLSREEYRWYVDVRRYGSVPMSGYGLGLERLLGICTGIGNIRDLVPFPRVHGSCRY
jgi:asparaginyl-tRNA synthetase